MLALIQRVSQAQVTVDDQVVGAIGPGLLALVAVEPGDSQEQIRRPIPLAACCWSASSPWPPIPVLVPARVFPPPHRHRRLNVLSTNWWRSAVKITRRGWKPGVLAPIW